jgi:hypothetical protein
VSCCFCNTFVMFSDIDGIYMYCLCHNGCGMQATLSVPACSVIPADPKLLAVLEAVWRAMQSGLSLTLQVDCQGGGGVIT